MGISPQQPPTCCTWVLRKSHIKPACHQSRDLLLCNLMRWSSWHQWQGAEELKWKCEYKPPCLGRCAHTGEATVPSFRGSLQDWGLVLSCSRPKEGSEGWPQLPLPCKPSQLTWPGQSGWGEVMFSLTHIGWPPLKPRCFTTDKGHAWWSGLAWRGHPHYLLL